MAAMNEALALFLLSWSATVVADNTANNNKRRRKITTKQLFDLILALCIVFTVLAGTVTGKMCYSCAGTCHNEHHCNCQMGSCEADYCFIEKRPATGHQSPPLYRIIKGCVKRPSRTRLGCDYDHFASHVLCICNGDFCNDAITLRRRNPLPIVSTTRHIGGGAELSRNAPTPNFRHNYHRPNVTCRLCGERRRAGAGAVLGVPPPVGASGGGGDCDATCRGEWCHEKVSTGGAGCGFGPPSLPYFYRGPELLWERGAKVCVTLSRGNGAPHKYCVCNTPMCNETPAPQQRVTPPFPFSLFGGGSVGGGGTTTAASLNHRSRSVVSPYSYPKISAGGNLIDPLPIFDCVNCDLTVEQSVFTSNCKSNRCYGHFCTYATQRVFGTAAAVGSSGAQMPAIIHERQGCMNVTDARQVQLGCTHKWMNNEEEEIYCACRGDNCNSDLTTAAESGAIHVTVAHIAFYTISLLLINYQTLTL